MNLAFLALASLWTADAPKTPNIVFIASDEASFITGHILNVDGGHSAG